MASVPNETSFFSSIDKTIRITVIGGGIGGLCLAIGLLKYPHIDVQIYEAAPSFGEIGAGVAIGPNAERALDVIGPAAREALRKHATTNLWPSRANISMQYRVVSDRLDIQLPQFLTILAPLGGRREGGHHHLLPNDLNRYAECSPCSLS